jgi:hypothetical protein
LTVGGAALANPLAWAALFGWPLIALTCFALRRASRRCARTTAWLMLLPAMLLPSSFAWDPPLLPAIDKHRMAVLSVAVGLLLFHRRQLLRRAPGHNFPRLVAAAILAGVVGTVLGNRDTLVYGTTVLPGLTAHDVVSLAISVVLDVYLPFAIGQRVFRTEQDLRDLLAVLSTAALLYLPLLLLEVRLSPQLHNWVYGFHPSAFSQTVRQGGYRPMVFMTNGLAVAMWVMSCLGATLALRLGRARTPVLPVGARVAVDWILLVLCKSLAPAIYAGATTLLAWLARPRVAARVIVAVVAVVTIYPVLRANQAFPTERLVEFFGSISAERAQSLDFRLDNEDALLARAEQRPVFGWGTFGRNRVYSAEGQDLSVTDGYWIILLGCFGYVGWAGFLALFAGPLLRFVRRQGSMPREAAQVLAVFALVVAFFALDMLPNAPWDSLPLLYAGALWTLSDSCARPADGPST